MKKYFLLEFDTKINRPLEITIYPDQLLSRAEVLTQVYNLAKPRRNIKKGCKVYMLVSSLFNPTVQVIEGKVLRITEPALSRRKIKYYIKFNNSIEVQELNESNGLYLNKVYAQRKANKINKERGIK